VIRINTNIEDLEKAISVISTTIANCEKAQIKFSDGTAQHSLLRNRIKALNISRSLLSGDKTVNHTSKDLREALPPVVSIINKTRKAQSKYEKETTQFNRFEPLIQAMIISKTYIEKQLDDDNL
jgi:hypothetical protein